MSERTMLVDSSGSRYLFDAVFSAARETSVTITDHPVQSGAAVADHAFVEPETVTLEIGMSDAMTKADTIAGAAQSRSVTAYQKLRDMCLKREPLTLVTRLGSLGTMLIASVAAEESFDTMNALRAEVLLKRMNMVQVCEVSVQQTQSSSTLTYENGGDGGADALTGSYTGVNGGGTQGTVEIGGASYPAGLIALLQNGPVS